MKNSSKKLYELTEKVVPDNILTNEYGEKYANAAVTFDGTWTKRNHQLKQGVLFAQKVRTGGVLGYAVKSLFCHRYAR